MADAIRINGEQPTFGDLEFKIDGIDFTDVIAIDWTLTAPVTGVNAVGKKNRFYTKGVETYTGSITLLHTALITLRKAIKDLGYSSLTKLGPFTIIVKKQFLGGEAEITLLQDCLFTNDGLSASASSNDALSTQLTLFVGSIVPLA